MVQFKGWQRWQGGCLALGLSLVLGWGCPAQAAEGKCYKRSYTFNFLAENDLWGSGSDKHFTHGTRLSFVESREEIKDAPSTSPLRGEGKQFEVFPHRIHFLIKLE